MKVWRLARRYHKIMDHLARHFAESVTEHPFCRRIAEDCPAFFVDHYDGVQGAIAKLSKRRLALAEGALSALALRDVARDRDCAYDDPVRVAHRSGRRFNDKAPDHVLGTDDCLAAQCLASGARLGI